MENIVGGLLQMAFAIAVVAAVISRRRRRRRRRRLPTTRVPATGPAPPIVRRQVATPPARTPPPAPAPEPASLPAVVPPATPEPAPAGSEHEVILDGDGSPPPSDARETEPVWAELPDSTNAEVLAAWSDPDRNAAERTLRRLSLNGVHSADTALGLLLMQWERIHEAEGAFRAAAPYDAVAANNLGVLNERGGLVWAAVREYRQAARLGSPAAEANLRRLGHT